MKRINRKGFLLGEFTLKVIIAVLCIIVLAFLVIKIYGALTNKPEIAKAEGTLERVLEKIRVADNEGKEQGYVLIEPRDWVLIYKPTGAPEMCSGRNCLCVCEKEDCSQNSVCEIVSREIIMTNSIKIESVDIVVREMEDGKFSIEKA